VQTCNSDTILISKSLRMSSLLGLNYYDEEEEEEQQSNPATGGAEKMILDNMEGVFPRKNQWFLNKILQPTIYIVSNVDHTHENEEVQSQKNVVWFLAYVSP
jgi:hypothetical protein